MNRSTRNPRHLRFTVKVMLYLLIAYVLMAVLFGGMYYINARGSTENRVIEEISHSVDRSRDEVQSLITQIENLYLNLLFDEDLYNLLSTYDPAAVSYPQMQTKVTLILRRSVRNLDAITSVQLLSDDYIFCTQNSTYTSTLNVNKSEIYRHAKQHKQPFWTPVYDFTVEYGHIKLEDPALPILNRNLVSYVGQFNGFKQTSYLLEMWPASIEKPIISISISEDYLRRILSNSSELYNSQCCIIDASGRNVSHTDPDRLFTPMDAEILDLLNAQEGQSGTLMLRRGSMLHYSRLSNGWTLCMITPLKGAYSEIYGVIWSTLIGMLLSTLVLCIVLSVIVSRSLSLPIKQLLQAINITADGNFAANLPRTGDEFDAVNTAFNSMVQRIEALIHENYEVKLRERENELRALKYQTKPHFLYNALNIIHASAMKGGDEKTAQMVLTLSNVLRYVLRGDQNLATIREEISNVMDYFELMRVGYNDAIALEVDVDPGILSAVICKMTLQPLVENCVQHGLTDLPNGGRVRITGRVVGQSISLVVSDNGSGWPEDFHISDNEHETESIGLANVRRRIMLTFGSDCVFRLFSPEDGGAAVEIVIPYQFSTN